MRGGHTGLWDWGRKDCFCGSCGVLGMFLMGKVKDEKVINRSQERRKGRAEARRPGKNPGETWKWLGPI